MITHLGRVTQTKEGLKEQLINFRNIWKILLEKSKDKQLHKKRKTFLSFIIITKIKYSPIFNKTKCFNFNSRNKYKEGKNGINYG